MSQSTYIKLVEGSKQDEMSLEDIKELLLYYIQMTEYTSQQLNWDYHHAAFPYELSEGELNENKYLILKGNSPYYNYLLIGTGQDHHSGTPYIQITLPSSATHGDKSKANELAKFLAKKVKGELHLFNKRIIYFK